MPLVRNKTDGKIRIADEITIRGGETVMVPDDLWSGWLENPASVGLASATLTVVAQTGPETAGGETEPEPEVRVKAYGDAMTEMLREDPERNTAHWWMSDGRISVAELRNRTGLRDIKAAERDELHERWSRGGSDTDGG